MPFVSSVSSALGGRLWSLVKGSLPTVTISSVTNFNQDRATFNGTVSANGSQTTEIKFQIYRPEYGQWDDVSNLDFQTTVTNTNLQNVNVFFNCFWSTLPGGLGGTIYVPLDPGTTYQVRLLATNSAGTAVSDTVSFTTWSLKTYTKTTSGSFSVEIPSITPTGESTIAPTILEMILYGGGGGANYGGGGGGGYRLFSSHTSSTTGTQTISGSVGAGGAAGNGGTGTGTATSGGSTTLTIGTTTWTGGGGTAGEHPGQVGNPFGRGGTVGSGTNGVNLGGTNAYGYYYFTGNYVQVVVGYNTGISGYDKNGNPQYYTDYNSPIYGPDYNQPIYAWNASYYACGGGGGTDSAGSNATGHTTASQVGGNGGTGGGAYGLRGGNGGGGYGTQGNGSAGGFSVGSGTIVGSGGSQFGAGLAGGITFKYYGP